VLVFGGDVLDVLLQCLGDCWGIWPIEAFVVGSLIAGLVEVGSQGFVEPTDPQMGILVDGALIPLVLEGGFPLLRGYVPLTEV